MGQHPAADGLMALVEQGRTLAANGRDTSQNDRDFRRALRDSGIPEGAELAELIAHDE